ncbi:CDP-glucose 4,6-dehydratase [Cyanobium sp. Morenito 9A2]|nr:CDP-glucose 4,6-dehydratase [Cyanobium sp. Morenito 9A2]
MLSPDPFFWQGRRVLLTGHTGFKGSWLTLWLLELGAEVWGLSLPPEGQPNLFQQLGLAGARPERLRHHDNDLLDSAQVRELVEQCRPELVFHLAAQSLVRRGYRDPLLTWQTNVIGTLQLLEALRQRPDPCAVVCVTTDKVYENHGGTAPFLEGDRLGGSDPYSSSKAAMELAVASWRDSFCGSAPHQHPGLTLATARAGNVIGGGDWAEDRILPDAIRALQAEAAIVVRQPAAIRPWQHVLDPLAGYLLLAERLHQGDLNERAFNFGPDPADSRSVAEVVDTLLRHWPGQWQEQAEPQAPAESGELRLNSERARQLLGWRPLWSFELAVARSAGWYRAVHQGASPLECCLADLASYQQSVHRETSEP